MRRLSTISIAISIGAHAAIIAACLLLPSFSGEKDRAGTEETIGVWIAPLSSGPTSMPSQARTRDVLTGHLPKPKEVSAMASPEATKPSASEQSRGVAGSFHARGSGGQGNEVLSRIWKRINEAKRYPPAARRRRIEGSPRVIFAVQENGEVEWVKLAQSSGQSLLDEAALETVRRASPLPYYEGPITLSVRYSLK